MPKEIFYKAETPKMKRSGATAEMSNQKYSQNLKCENLFKSVFTLIIDFIDNQNT